MFALLNELGGYLLPGTAQPPDLTSLVTRLLLVNGAPLFDLYLERDVINRTRLAIFLDLPRRYGHTARLLHRPYPEVSCLLKGRPFCVQQKCLSLVLLSVRGKWERRVKGVDHLFIDR